MGIVSLKKGTLFYCKVTVTTLIREKLVWNADVAACHEHWFLGFQYFMQVEDNEMQGVISTGKRLPKVLQHWLLECRLMSWMFLGWKRSSSSLSGHLGDFSGSFSCKESLCRVKDVNAKLPEGGPSGRASCLSCDPTFHCAMCHGCPFPLCPWSILTLQLPLGADPPPVHIQGDWGAKN